MSRAYTVASSVTSPNSATLPIANILSNGSVRPKIIQLVMGSSAAPVAHQGRFSIQRCSTAGTPGSNPTPAPHDSGDPASITTSGLAVFSVGPTLGTTLLQFGLNQQATAIWEAMPGRELVGPATSNNGFALMNPTVDTAYAVDFSLVFEE